MNGTASLSAQLIIDCVNGLGLFNVSGKLCCQRRSPQGRTSCRRRQIEISSWGSWARVAVFRTSTSRLLSL